MENFTTELLRYYDHFVIPFNIGMFTLFAVLTYKYIRWFWKMPVAHKRLVGRGIFSRQTIFATGEVVSESLLHRRIFKVNPLLGYMHMSLALGWFLLIVVGWIEASLYLKGSIIPMHAHVFYQYFLPSDEHGSAGRIIAAIMDTLLIFVLSGVMLAWFKRMRSRALGMRSTTKHTRGDRLALSALWFVFPLRLLAEGSMSGLRGGGSYITGNLGEWMISSLGLPFTANFSTAAWWLYSISLGIFLGALPFSRYMHIFTEVPLIFLRRYGVRSDTKEGTFDHFQIEACSRCGICIDPCQLQKDADICQVQSVYFLRDRRYHKLKRETAENCLMCGRCEQKCPVDIELNSLRLNSRVRFTDTPADNRYSYLSKDKTSHEKMVTGYFAGCMTLLSPVILRSMEQIFESSGEQIWWADRDGGVCCGRPLKLAGEVSAAQNMMRHNAELFRSRGITRLVTSCPICLKVFREDYKLEDIEVLHHSEYILQLISAGKLTLNESTNTYVYHDPCELGRGCGIYEEPREVIRQVGVIVEGAESRENAPCCGGSLANTAISDRSQQKIAAALAESFERTGADTVVTSCPLCKKTLARHHSSVKDIAEVVAAGLNCQP